MAEREKWFVVRRGPNLNHAFEYTDQDPATVKAPKGEYLFPVVYFSVMPEQMTLIEAITLFKEGKIVKPEEAKPARTLRPLADILAIKRRNRAQHKGFAYNEEDYYLPVEPGESAGESAGVNR